MHDHSTFEEGLKYRPEYSWPEEGSIRNCPRCDDEMELIENLKNYYGKPWWCSDCQWQFSEEEFQEKNHENKSEE
ncbi:MAG: hypothetical protein CMG62_01365 [Candidatus Marinimicrobia bacterium]|nr:hypothetical protein [Candidatus Neomarinimicrobiota bacterium]